MKPSFLLKVNVIEMIKKLEAQYASFHYPRANFPEL